MNNKSRIIIFPVLVLLLLLLVIFQNWQLLTNNNNSVVYTYLRSFASGEIGSGYGSATAGDIPFSILEPGDILLGDGPTVPTANIRMPACILAKEKYWKLMSIMVYVFNRWVITKIIRNYVL
jgi:hypothetical protein